MTLFAQHWPEEAAELATRTAIEATICRNRRRTGDRPHSAASAPDLGQIDPFRTAPQEGRRADRTGRRAASAALRRVHQLHRPVRPVNLHAHGAGRGRIPAGLRRLRGRHHGLGPSWLCPHVRPSGVRSLPQQRDRLAGIRARQPAVCQPGHVLRQPLSPGGRRDRPRFARLHVNVEKRYVTEQAGDASYGQSGGVAIDAMPLTDLDLAHESRITEDEHLRFSMPVSVLGRLRKTQPRRQGVQDRRSGGQLPARTGHRIGQPWRSGPGQARRTRPLDLLGLRGGEDPLCRARRDRQFPEDPQGTVRA